LAGLGRSEIARFYGIGSIDEARAYLADPVLGPRLHDCTAAVLTHRGTDAETIFGPVDALKFRSSMTLFEAAADDPALFADALETFHEGRRDPATLAMLEGA